MGGDHTRLSVCFARSLTACRAMMGILSAALWGLLLLASKFWLKSLLDMAIDRYLSFRSLKRKQCKKDGSIDILLRVND